MEVFFVFALTCLILSGGKHETPAPKNDTVTSPQDIEIKKTKDEVYIHIKN